MPVIDSLSMTQFCPVAEAHQCWASLIVSLMKRVAIVLLVTGLPFGLFMGGLISIFLGWRLALILGIASGLAFGIGMTVFAELAKSRVLQEHPSFEGESLLKDGPANHFVGAEGVGGWLYLTNERVHFQSHAVNIQTHQWTIGLREVVRVEAMRTLGILANGLRIVTPSSQERFVVNGSKSWVAAILSAKQVGFQQANAADSVEGQVIIVS